MFPAQLHDAKSAIRWLRAHAADYGLDPERFAFMGDSSGGWLATMMALTSGRPEFDGDVGVSTEVQAAVDFYGPTDFLQMDAHMPNGGEEFRNHLGIQGCHDDPGSPESRLVGGPIEARRDACARANPISYVAAGAPPMMILHGRRPVRPASPERAPLRGSARVRQRSDLLFDPRHGTRAAVCLGSGASRRIRCGLDEDRR